VPACVRLMVGPRVKGTACGSRGQLVDALMRKLSLRRNKLVPRDCAFSVCANQQRTFLKQDSEAIKVSCMHYLCAVLYAVSVLSVWCLY